MSPPQVNLSEKKDPESTLIESNEKLDDFDCPDFISIVSKDRHDNHCHQHHKCKRCIIYVIAVVIVLSVAASIAIPLAIKKIRHDKHQEDRVFFCGTVSDPYRVDIDHDKHMIHAQHYGPSGDKHILHVYEISMVAYKNGELDACFIERLDESFEEGLIRWKSYKDMDLGGNRRFQVLNSKPIEVEVLKQLTDHHIFELCQQTKSMWVREMNPKEETNAKTVIF